MPSGEGSHPPAEDVWPQARVGAGTQVAQALRLGCPFSFSSTVGSRRQCWLTTIPASHSSSSPLSLFNIITWFYFSVFQFPRIFFKIFSPRNTQRRTSFSDVCPFDLQSQAALKRGGFCQVYLRTLAENPQPYPHWASGSVRTMWGHESQVTIYPQTLNYCLRSPFLPSGHTAQLTGNSASLESSFLVGLWLGGSTLL